MSVGQKNQHPLFKRLSHRRVFVPLLVALGALELWSLHWFIHRPFPEPSNDLIPVRLSAQPDVSLKIPRPYFELAWLKDRSSVGPESGYVILDALYPIQPRKRGAQSGAPTDDSLRVILELPSPTTVTAENGKWWLQAFGQRIGTTVADPKSGETPQVYESSRSRSGQSGRVITFIGGDLKTVAIFCGGGFRCDARRTWNGLNVRYTFSQKLVPYARDLDSALCDLFSSFDPSRSSRTDSGKQDARR